MGRLSRSEKQAVTVLKEVQHYTTELEKVMKLNLEQEESLQTLPGKIVSGFAESSMESRLHQLITNPKVFIDAENKYLEALLKIQPDNKTALRTLNNNYFFSMNFGKMIALRESAAWMPGHWDEFIENVQHGEIGTGIEGFKEMFEYTKLWPPFFNTPVIAYNADKFQDNPEFLDCVAEVLFRHYPDQGKPQLIKSGSTLTLIAPELTHLNTWPTHNCFLRFIRFKELIVKDSAITDAWQFRGLPVVKLDIRGTRIQNLNPLCNLSSLMHVRVREGQISRRQIKNSVQNSLLR